MPSMAHTRRFSRVCFLIAVAVSIGNFSNAQPHAGPGDDGGGGGTTTTNVAPSTASNSSSCSIIFQGTLLQYQACSLRLSVGVDVYWNITASEIDTLFAATPASGGYVAWGWGDQHMIGSSVAVAYANGSGTSTTAILNDFYLGDYSSSSCKVANKQGMTLKQAEVLANGTIRGRFVRPLGNGITNGSTSAIWAVGPRVSGGDILNNHGSSKRAAAVFDLSNHSGAVQSRSVSYITTALKVHGGLMAGAWLLLGPAGIFIMRYLKKYNPLTFQLHRALMLTTVVVAAISYAIGVFKKTGPDRVALSLHTFSGTAAMILAVLQVISGIFRPHKGTPRRKWFNYIHWWTGRSALLLAVVALFVGLYLANASALLYVLMAVAVAIWAALFTVFGVFLKGPFPVVE